MEQKQAIKKTLNSMESAANPATFKMKTIHQNDIESQRYKRLQQQNPYQRVRILDLEVCLLCLVKFLKLFWDFYVYKVFVRFIISWLFQRYSFVFILVFILFFALMRIIIWCYQHQYIYSNSSSIDTTIPENDNQTDVFVYPIADKKILMTTNY